MNTARIKSSPSPLKRSASKISKPKEPEIEQLKTALAAVSTKLEVIGSCYNKWYTSSFEHITIHLEKERLS